MTSRNGPDPLAEAKVYVAYGRYEQAAELLELALQAEPSRTDLESLLAEVRAKGKGWSPSQCWPEVASSTLAIVGIILVFSFAASSIESVLGWVFVASSAILVVARTLLRRSRTPR